MLRWSEMTPILEAVYGLLDRKPSGSIEGNELADELGRGHDDRELERALRELHGAGYVKAYFGGDDEVADMIQATERGLQATMGWPKPGEAPDPAVLLAILDEQIRSPDTSEDERTRLRRLRESAGEVGKGALGSVLGAYLKHVVGI